MKHFLLSMCMIFLLVATLGFANNKDSQKETKTLHMTIEGMTCSLCSKTITKKLLELCETASVDHKKGHGMCIYITSKTTKDAIVKAVNSISGYNVVETKEE